MTANLRAWVARSALRMPALIVPALALLLAAAVSDSAHAAARQSWATHKSSDEVRLAFGIPDSGNLTLAFICEAKPKRMVIVSTVLPRNPRKGQALKTTLSNGTATATYGGKLGHTEAEGYYAEATAPADRWVIDILRSGKALTISIPGKQERVPLRGLAKPLAEFEAACFGKA
jgi:hypothetical protein